MSTRPGSIVIGAALFIISCSTTQSKRDCSRFRAGKFVYRKNIPDSALILIREGSVQTETDDRNSFLRRDSIVWRNDCEYELFYLSRTPVYPDDMDAQRRELFDELRKKPSNIKIIETGADYAVFEMRKGNINFVYTDTMWIVK